MTNHLSNKQFNTENYLRSQGNEDEIMNRVRGYQNMTSNVYRPAFSADYTAVRSMPSGTADGEGHSGFGMQEEENEAEA